MRRGVKGGLGCDEGCLRCRVKGGLGCYKGY